MKPANFDDVDLGIVAIVCIVALAVTGALGAIFLGVAAKDVAIALSFVGTGMGIIGGMVRGKNNGTAPPNQTPSGGGNA